MYSTGMGDFNGANWVLALEWLVVVGVFVLLAVGPAKGISETHRAAEEPIMPMTSGWLS